MSQFLFEARDLNKGMCAGMLYPYPTLTKDGGASVTVSAGKALLYTLTEPIQLKQFDVPEATFTLSSGNNLIRVVNNAGVAEYQNAATPIDNIRDRAPVFFCLYEPGATQEIQVEDLTSTCSGSYPDLIYRQTQVPNSLFSSNLDDPISSNASDHVLISALTGFRGVTPVTTNAFDSSTDDMYLYSWVTDPSVQSNWTKSTAITTFNSTQYNTSAGLQTVTVNQWTVNYIWKSLFPQPDNPNECFVTLGGADYLTSSAAQGDVPIVNPGLLPVELAFNAILIGRIIAQNGATPEVILQRDFYPVFWR